ncbi:YvcK family protein [Candidatus Roizmanbacteria bacterium]|nr:YvcK family protein [Candidatus Roizmanbacteria bacterium]
MKKITVIGGGTGTFISLSGLKKYDDIDLGVIVSMMDSGGSTGRLRDQLEVLPPGDLRQCLVALSDAPELWRKLFLYRFENGDLKGHNFGNIFLSALEKVTSNYEDVLKAASHVLKTKGKVLPVTFQKAHLCAEFENGETLIGEGNIDENTHDKGKILKTYLEPEVEATEHAKKRIAKSDVVVIGPGDLYTSIVPICLTKGMKEAFMKSQAQIVFIVNLMTKLFQTNGFTAYDHVTTLASYIGKMPDAVIMHHGEIPQDILEWYKENNEELVIDDLKKRGYTGKILTGDIIDRSPFVQSKSDDLHRSILRHDSEKLATLVNQVVSP